MKITYKVRPNLMLEFEVKGQKEFMETMAGLDEILKQSCQKCKKTEPKDLTFVVREVDGNKFYELKCPCGAVLSFGSHKTGGTLFPQRKEKNEEGDEVWLPDNGWTIWNPKTKKRE